MRVIFTCGGTAGHVNPALALAGLMKERHENTDILFVGANRGMERKLIERAGYPFLSVNISSFHRSIKPKEIAFNLVSLYNYMRAPGEAKAILKDFRPDLVVGTGGYASYPMIRAAARKGIPTAVHESNAIPGLTTKLLEPYADVIMVGFEACRKNYKHPEKVVVTGTPVRGEFFAFNKEEAKRRLGLDDGKPLVVSFWGSLGARVMNTHIADFITEEYKGSAFHHIHAAGTYGLPLVEGILQERGVDLKQQIFIDLREYIYDMPTVMRAADVVLCRAGASTISELTALGVPAIMVPSPNVTNNHQEKNARVLSEAGAALLLLEESVTGEKLLQETRRILDNKHLQEKMTNNSLSLGVRDAGERIYETVMKLKK